MSGAIKWAQSFDPHSCVSHRKGILSRGSIVLQHTKPSKQTDAPDRKVFAGLVERVTFHNAENGFCVLRVKARGRKLITVIGHAATITAGEWIAATSDIDPAIF